MASFEAEISDIAASAQPGESGWLAIMIRNDDFTTTILSHHLPFQFLLLPLRSSLLEACTQQRLMMVCGCTLRGLASSRAPSSCAINVSLFAARVPSRSSLSLSANVSESRSRGFGFVTYADPTSMDRVMAHNSPHMLDGRVIDPKPAIPRYLIPEDQRRQPANAQQTIGGGCKIFVGGLSSSTTPDTLKAAFEQVATVATVSIPRDPVTCNSRCFGFVVFHKEEDAVRACTIRHFTIDGQDVEARFAIARPIEGMSTTPRISAPLAQQPVAYIPVQEMYNPYMSYYMHQAAMYTNQMMYMQSPYVPTYVPMPVPVPVSAPAPKHPGISIPRRPLLPLRGAPKHQSNSVETMLSSIETMVSQPKISETTFFTIPTETQPGRHPVTIRCGIGSFLQRTINPLR